jgi:Kae1-associated kinase Bud32
VDFSSNSLILEWIEGEPVKYWIMRSDPAVSDHFIHQLAANMGEAIAQLHNHNIVHGDLTTSNMLVTPKGDETDIVMIDFGLSFSSVSIEDKAVDLYVLERCFTSSHPQHLYLVSFT